MTEMSNEITMGKSKSRSASLELTEKEAIKKNMLAKAKDKFFNIGEALKTNKILNGEIDSVKKSQLPQTTLDYFIKSCSNKSEKKDNSLINFQATEHHSKAYLKKNNSVGAYPISIEISKSEEQLDKLGKLQDVNYNEAPALALERPFKKKLSFREPEISGYSVQCNEKYGNKRAQAPEFKRSISAQSGLIKHCHSWEDINLENQAMKVVRTIGQAFEVCHKLSINAPEGNNDDQETLTQDLISDHISDVMSDKPKQEFILETNDKNSIHLDENSSQDNINSYVDQKNAQVHQSDLYTTTTMQTKLANALYEETNTCNMTDGYLSAGSESDIARNPKLLLAGSVGTAQNEIQLLKEQLDQQSQQTHAALIQLQLVREQLLTEQNARIEAQARTHQLLVHNKELLDHIAALVAHLQEEKTSVQSNNEPHVAMPQQNQNLMDGFGAEHSETSVPESSPLLQSWGLQSQGLIENQMVTSCLPPSPLRTSFNSTGSMFNCSYPTLQDATFEGQLLQRLQALIGYTPSYSYNYQPLIQSNLYGAPNLINSVYSLQTPPQKKISPINVMKSCTASPVLERRVSPGSNSDYIKQPEYPVQSSSHVNQNFQNLSAQQKYRTSTSPSSIQSIHTPSKLNSQTQEIHFIKPLSQLGTLTTTDVQGRVRVIVPIPSQSPNGDDDAGNLLSPLRVGDELRPQITRSTSEKVPNRSELMSQVQRTAWARHTTK